MRELKEEKIKKYEKMKEFKSVLDKQIEEKLKFLKKE